MELRTKAALAAMTLFVACGGGSGTGTPIAKFLGLDVNGKKVSFTENVFYELRNDKIWKVWSVIDKGAIESQLPAPAA